MTPNQRQEVMREMKSVAKMLRDEDPKKWTQEKIAKRLGVDRTTVSKWFELRSVNDHNPQQPKPDARVKLNGDAKKVVVKRVASGDTMSQVASDFGVDKATVSRVVKSNQKRQEEVRARAQAARDRTLFCFKTQNCSSMIRRSINMNLPSFILALIS